MSLGARSGENGSLYGTCFPTKSPNSHSSCKFYHQADTAEWDCIKKKNKQRNRINCVMMITGRFSSHALIHALVSSEVRKTHAEGMPENGF
ncbi:hypothetical protein CDAR_18471 [Caerostris darwini]|uniref:Uncharacterized protein n=1 Tax=Caerostris darwini TaxID=1538125 RepID=A0AAV4VA28_9ARAC|nr:hypothetical protein CDAR_18471 [Caerostris darwini]